MQKKLRKSSSKKLFGVCAGLAEYLDVDPTLVRVVFLIAFFGFGTGLTGLQINGLNTQNLFGIIKIIAAGSMKAAPSQLRSLASLCIRDRSMRWNEAAGLPTAFPAMGFLLKKVRSLKSFDELEYINRADAIIRAAKVK